MERFTCILLSIVFFLASCSTAQLKDNRNYDTSTGYLILFDNHEFNYYIPSTVKIKEDLYGNFVSSKLDTGFVVAGLDRKLRWDLIQTKAKNINTGLLAKVLPVQIKYTTARSYNKEMLPLAMKDIKGDNMDIYLYNNKFLIPKEVVLLENSNN